MAANPVIAPDSVDLELEAMRTDGCSWHPCQVYFSPTGAGLVIKYGNGSQDILANEKEALTRIRARSLPLQDDDCTHIKPGEHVVVNQNSQTEGGFFDAEVEKVLRVRHSKRMQCRCNFMIKWLHQDVNGGSLKVPSSSLMRLANKSINNHPTIASFIDAAPLSNSGMSPQLNVVSDIDLDLHDLLEKQIEGIRNSVHGPKKKIRDEILDLEDATATNEQVKETLISGDMSHSRRLNWSPSNEEELPDNKSPLNPLAARAALASLMSKLPKSLETSLNEEGKAFNSLNLAYYSSSEIEINKLSETEVSPKPGNVVKKSLFSTRSSSEMSRVNKSKKGHKKADDSNVGTNVTQLRRNKTKSEIGTRLTGAKTQKVNDIPDDNIEQSTVANRRLTRSALNKEGERQITENASALEKDLSTSGCKSKSKKTLCTTSSPVAEFDHALTSGRKNILKMEEGNKGIVDSSNTRRGLTRSTLNKEAASIAYGTIKESDVNLSPAEESKKIVISGEETLPTKKRNKRKTPGITFVAQVSEGKVTSNGSKKNLPDLKKHKVRSSPRFLHKS